MIDFGGHVPKRKTLDLTPMIDVVFLLLIFFMLTSIFGRPMLPLNLPESETGNIAEEPGLSVTLLQDGTLHLDNEPIRREDLAAALSKAFEGAPNRELSLRADQGVLFGEVVKVMDLSKKGGAEEISVVTEAL